MIWNRLLILYNAELRIYRLLYSTEERTPGIHDLLLGFGDGQSERIQIELLPPTVEEGG